MVEGTDEWNQKMKEVSSTVDELLEKYPELMKYGTYNYETGTYSFDPAQLEKFSQDKDKELLAG
jgi:Tfp pilus assembly protein PilP